MNVTGILLLVAGIVGCLPLDGRIAWALVAVAGGLMLI